MSYRGTIKLVDAVTGEETQKGRYYNFAQLERKFKYLSKLFTVIEQKKYIHIVPDYVEKPVKVEREVVQIKPKQECLDFIRKHRKILSPREIAATIDIPLQLARQYIKEVKETPREIIRWEIPKVVEPEPEKPFVRPPAKYSNTQWLQ